MVSKTTNITKKTVKTVKTNVITVKNADGDPDTTATILIQNKIKYTPKVSVIIPVYNVEKYLRESLDSVINQTLKEIEIICVDDGSTDSSLEILKEYAKKDKRITVITQKNLHAGVARNAGLSVAKGEYLSFLDSDDFFELNMLKEMYGNAKKLKTDICICDADIYDEQKKALQKTDFMLKKCLLQENKPVFDRSDLGKDIYKFTCSTAWNKIYKKDFVIKNDLYFQNLTTCNDIGMFFSALSLANRISVIDKVFVHYRFGSDSQITKHRGKGAINILHAYNYIVKHLVKNNLQNLKPLLIKQIKYNIQWEMGFCNYKEQKSFKDTAKKLIQEQDKDIYKFIKPENKVMHFIHHLGRLFGSKIKRAWEYPVRTHEKYHYLKDKIRKIKKSK